MTFRLEPEEKLILYPLALVIERLGIFKWLRINTAIPDRVNFRTLAAAQH
jgi:hypothetical protein